MFLKLYETERVHITIAGIADLQLFREKVWPIVEEIAAQRKFVVSFSKKKIYYYLLFENKYNKHE